MKSFPLRRVFGFGLGMVLVAAMVAAAFWRAPELDFIDYDDPVTVLDPRLRGGLTGEAVRFAFTETPANLWLPLTSLSHALDFQIYGDWAGGHHLTNVLLHLASCLLLLAWLRRHTGEAALSLAVVLLFAVHPLRVESVAWVAERKDVLSLYFYLLAIWFYSARTRADGRGRGRHYVLALVAAVLGLLSKPSLITLPVVLLLIDVWPLQRLGWEDRRDAARLRALLLEKVPFVVLALAAAAVAWASWSGSQFIGEAPDLPLTHRIGYASLAYLSYLARTLVPVDLVPFRSYPVGVSGFVMVGAAVLLALATVLVLRRHRVAPWLTVGWLWFLATILPGSGLVTISDHFAPDRYTYLAHIGLFLALVWEIGLGGRRRRVSAFAGWVVLAIALAPLLVLTYRQTLVWRNPEALWRHTLEASGANHVAHNQLGLFLLQLGRTDEGIAELRAAVAANPAFPIPLGNLSRAMAAQGEWLEAARLLRQAGPRLPGHQHYRRELLAGSLQAGDSAAAAELWRDLVEEDPADLATRLGAGEFFFGLGQEEGALRHYRAAAETAPEHSGAAVNLGALLLQRGDLAAALPWLERAVASARDPADAAEARRVLAQGQVLGRNWAAAIAHYEQALAQAPDHRLLRNELAQLLLDCPEPALRNPARALELAESLAADAKDDGGPADPRVLRTLARAQEEAGKTEALAATATSGLEAVEFLLREDPPKPPWRREELESLRSWFSARTSPAR